jgi:hypothetical protein
VFVEQDNAGRVIEANLAHTRLGDRARAARDIAGGVVGAGPSEEGF